MIPERTGGGAAKRGNWTQPHVNHVKLLFHYQAYRLRLPPPIELAVRFSCELQCPMFSEKLTVKDECFSSKDRLCDVMLMPGQAKLPLYVFAS